MFNGLAGKLLGIIAVGTTGDQADKSENQVIPDVCIDDDDGEWVLVEELEDSSDDCNLDLELTPSVNGTSVGSLSPLSTAKALGWNLTPPPCFLASSSPHHYRHHYRGRNKYKHVKHVNPNKVGVQQRLRSAKTDQQRQDHKSTTTHNRALKPHQNANCMDASLFSNMLIEHPSMSVYYHCSESQLGANDENNESTSPSSLFGLKPSNEGHECDSTTKENVAPFAPPPPFTPCRVESQVNPCYVITGLDVCSPLATVPAPGQRLQILQLPQTPQAGRRRAKRQHFTIYDAALSAKSAGAGGGFNKLPKQKLKNSPKSSN